MRRRGEGRRGEGRCMLVGGCGGRIAGEGGEVGNGGRLGRGEGGCGDVARRIGVLFLACFKTFAFLTCKDP